MQKLKYTAFINAPREKVWHTMLDKETYSEWTKVFSPGSYYKGDWNKGSKIIFVGPDPASGEEGGMVGMIEENIPYEFVSIKYIGMIKDGKDVPHDDAEAAKWGDAHENYTFKDKDGGTELLVEIDVADEYADMFNGMWPNALEALKALAEK
jgi:hypothetical protein